MAIKVKWIVLQVWLIKIQSVDITKESTKGLNVLIGKHTYSVDKEKGKKRMVGRQVNCNR